MSYFQIPGSLCDEIQPYSPLARVLKARYHKDYSILEASEGHAPSYIWRSLCDSRVVLARRSRWQIGNGWSVKVWGDRWIPKPNSFQITSATVTGHENVLVCELINPVLHKWHEDLVHAWFGAQEASCILHLPLSFRIPADRLVWHYEKQGDLTVCSAYEVARQFLFEEAGEGSSNRDNYYGVSTKAWSRLWWVCVPPKVKVFVWRVLHNILPTRDRLLSEGVQGDLGGCVLCGAQAESLPHVLLDCSFTALICLSSPLRTKWRDRAIGDLNGWLEHVLLREDSQRLNSSSCCYGVYGMSEIRWSGRQRVRAKWQKPLLGAIKINVDGAFNVQISTGGGGLIALLFARGLDPGPKLIERDAQDVFQNIIAEREDRSQLSFLISDCRSLLF
ncbi:unnamed protein product [Prunus armeniaca]|uniref:Reverse transcriptase zinc-binding domain-containing protein n=1 Tax=Prunus armeniaca TaxID=36596 RepID=A0A6J5TJY3_PRUAR|nr:unnamed protein product [Prunus armeniaca]